MPGSRLSLCAVLSASILFAAVSARAQDPGTQAAMQANQIAIQQTMQAAQQATQQAIQDNLAASQLAQQQSLAALQNAQMNASRCCDFPAAWTPRFSRKGGTFKTAIDVRLTDTTPGAVIYFTTDGWTPTSASTQYTAPIPITSTTLLQAIAVAPHRPPSRVAAAAYILPGAPQAQPAAVNLPALPAGPNHLILGLDAPVPLLVAAPVDSATALLGDPISFTLAEDLKAGDQVVAPRGTPAVGTVIGVDHPLHGGVPGHIVFEVNALLLNGQRIPLFGSETMAGKDATHKATAMVFIPFVGVTAVLVRGDEARILPGATVTATMAAGTVLTNPQVSAN